MGGMNVHVQPGQRAGLPLTEITASGRNVADNVLADARTHGSDVVIEASPVPNGTIPPPRDSYYLVALVADLTEGAENYHFLRQDSNGMWSQKD